MKVVYTSFVFRVTLRVRREDLRESHERSRLLPPRSTAEWGCTVAVLLGGDRLPPLSHQTKLRMRWGTPPLVSSATLRLFDRR